jgi:2-hydroxy-6-oxonona-2,4-dienedioate hydrolase
MSDTRPANFSSVWADLRGVSFKQHYIDAGGIRTRCIESGDPSKALVLALHGVGGHAEAYSRNFGPHADHFWFVAIDMLGHGWTDKPAIDYQVKDYADHVLAVLQTLGRDKAMISGDRSAAGSRPISPCIVPPQSRSSFSTPPAAGLRTRRSWRD